jgi:hypothetical protein
VFLNKVNGLKPVLSLRYHADVISVLEQIGKFVAGKLLIVHDHSRERHSGSWGVL